MWCINVWFRLVSMALGQLNYKPQCHSRVWVESTDSRKLQNTRVQTMFILSIFRIIELDWCYAIRYPETCHRMCMKFVLALEANKMQRIITMWFLRNHILRSQLSYLKEIPPMSQEVQYVKKSRWMVQKVHQSSDCFFNEGASLVYQDKEALMDDLVWCSLCN